MVFLWFSRGFPRMFYDFLWFSHGFPMDFLWISYGFPILTQFPPIKLPMFQPLRSRSITFKEFLASRLPRSNVNEHEKTPESQGAETKNMLQNILVIWMIMSLTIVLQYKLKLC